MMFELAHLSIILALAIVQDDPPEVETQEPAVQADSELSRQLAEDLAMLEALLRVRETRVTEATRQLDYEKDILDALRQREEAGGIPDRMLKESEARLIGAEAFVEARQADRDEMAIRLQQVRRFAESPSPEPTIEQLRDRLEDEVAIREIQLRAREARLRAADAMMTSEELKRDQFRDSIQRGSEGPGRIRQATQRVAEAASLRDTMIAEREVSRLQLDRARRKLDQFDDPDQRDPTLERPPIEDLAARVTALESLVDVLRDELSQVHWDLQGLRNRLP